MDMSRSYSDIDLRVATGGENDKNIGGPLFEMYFRFIKKWKHVIVVWWFIILFWGMVTGKKFLSMGNDNMEAPSGTRAYDAQQQFEQRFTKMANQVPLLVLIECLNDSCSLESKELFTFVDDLWDQSVEYNKTHYNVISSVSYYQTKHTLLSDISKQFISKDKKLTFMNIVVNATQPTSERYKFVDYLIEFVEENHPGRDKYDIGFSGFDPMAKDSSSHTEKEVQKIDMFTMPVAFALLGYMIKSWRLLLIGIVNMGAAILSGFAIMVVLIDSCGLPHPENACAQLMEVMALAMSIDYSLFLNRRYRDEIKIGMDPETAVYHTMLHAGHVVLMSGLTIIVVFLGFLILPAATVIMDGASCAIAITMCLWIALTNTPALLLTFPTFFSTFDGCCGRCKQQEYGVLNASLLNDDDDTTEIGGVGMLERRQSSIVHDGERIELVPGQVHPMYLGSRFKFTKKVVTWPCNLISVIVLYILVLPLAYQVTDMKVNQDVIYGVPRDSHSGIMFRKMHEEFPNGIFAPFYLLINAPRTAEEGVFDKKVFDAAREFSKEIIKREKFANSVVTAPSYLAGNSISPSEAKKFLKLAKSQKCKGSFFLRPIAKEECKIATEYKYMWDMAVNAQEDSMLITIIVPFFPFASESSDFIDDVYKLIKELEKKYGDDSQPERYYIDKFTGMELATGNWYDSDSTAVEFYFVGFEVGFDAIMRNVYHLFPTLILITLASVYTVLSFLLKSAFVPIRLSLTLVLPLAGVFGLAVLVYQKGVLDWTGIAALQKISGFFWYVPILITSMIVGLALDYDVFLISRVMEHRMGGYEVKAAIVKAVCETGGTISSAGIIMTLAFGGMLLGDQSITNQCGFLLASAVLFDTFIVNTILVPCLLSFADHIAWWPTKPPMAGLITLDDPEFTGVKAR